MPKRRYRSRAFGDALNDYTREQFARKAAQPAQPALPGAEGVQSTENPTPTFNAEYSLTPEASTRAAIQKGLF